MDKPHKKLKVWQDAMVTARDIYRLTSLLPSEEKFGLISQMRRAAVSIPCNIAEGAARRGKKVFINFLSIAQGSLSELDTQLELCVLLGFLEPEGLGRLQEKLTKVDKMLTGLIRSLQ